MRVVVIGGTGHVGTYLVPRLVHAGHDVTVISRSQREPYQPHGAWSQVKRTVIDRSAAEEAGVFGAQIRALEPDIVIDMICFTLDSAKHLVEAVRGQVSQFLHCGTIWIHGPSVVVPTTEEQPPRPFGEYGIQKAQIEAYLLEQARKNAFPAACLHPGHIVGPGWNPLNPQGNFNLSVFETIARGEELALPHLGLETVHHVHADDVAQSFMCAMENWSTAVGQGFHVVSPAAITLRGYAEAMALFFGQAPRINYLPWDQFEAAVSKEDAAQTLEHIAHSPNCSIEKARRLINYQPSYSSLGAVEEAVRWLVDSKQITV